MNQDAAVHANYVLTVRFKEGMQEIFLPGENNRLVNLPISKEISGFGRDIYIALDIYDGVWRARSNEYITLKGGDEIQLEDGQTLEAYAENHQPMYVFVDQIHPGVTQFIKYVLPTKPITIGSDTSCDISFSFRMDGTEDNQLVGKRHAVIEKHPFSGTVINDNNSTNGTFVNGKRIYGQNVLKYGDKINIFGLKIIFFDDLLAINTPKGKISINGLSPYVPPAPQMPETPPQDEYYQRSPRRMSQLDMDVLKINPPPDEQKAQPQPMWMRIGPLLTMMVPMSAGLIFSSMQSSTGGQNPLMYMSLISSGAAASMGVFWAVMNNRHSKNTEQQKQATRVNRYERYIERITNALEGKRNKNWAALNEAYPHTNECMRWAIEKNHHIYERNIHHPDFLMIRFGIGKRVNPNIEIQPETYSVNDDPLAEKPYIIQKTFAMLEGVPVCLSLFEHRLIGVVSDRRAHVMETARIIAAQIGILHAYTDVKMVFIYPEKENWDFARWFPHTWANDGSIRMVANDANAVGEVFYHLSAIVRDRTDQDAHRKEEIPLPHYVVFIADPSLVENEPVMKHILSPTPEMGFTTVLFYDRMGQVPNNCTVIIERGNNSGFYSLDNAFPESGGIDFDKVSEEHLTEAVRSLSGMAIREATGSGEVPSMLTFMSMFKASAAAEVEIYHNWLKYRTYESMKALIGHRGGGAPLYLDLHEKYHGPHGLVAGTTGSGKSEVLQTYILSLAMTYHPHEVSFILIDYKGGGMANSFLGLPHLSGIITNLGGNETNRALASINSEIKKRQAVFNEYHIKHIDSYIELYRNKRAEQPIPHLIIIADEFAELKREQPEFVSELVSASRVGRSLGVHLILATQKPDGVVDDQIWSNSRFRLCLRVQDKADSMGMLKRPEAAYITNAGRGYFQVGNDEIFEEFQSGWSGAPYEPDVPFTDEKRNEIRMINLFGRPSVLASGSKKKNKGPKEERVTQLTAMVRHISDVAKEHDIFPVSGIWLDSLPDSISLADLDKRIREKSVADYSGQDKPYDINPVIGIVDDPASQEQRILRLDFLRENHVFLCGGSAGGKTTFIQTVLYSLVTTKTPQHLSVYIADFGSRTLGVFGLLPHVGEVLFDDDLDKVDKLINMLLKELSRRKEHLSSRNVSLFREYAAHYDDLPAILFIIDNYAAFITACEKHEGNILTLSREAASYGIYLLTSCNSTNEMRSRIQQNFRFGVGLQLTDPTEYAQVLGERRVSITAGEHRPGRGLIKDARPSVKERETPVPLEFQTALCHNAANPMELNNMLISEFKAIADAWKGPKARRVPQVPSDLSYEAFAALPEAEALRKRDIIPIGFDVKEAEMRGIDVSDTFCYSIGGNIKSGKTNALKVIAMESKAMGCDVRIIDAKDRPLARWAGENGFEHYYTSGEELFSFIKDEFIGMCTERRDKFKAMGGKEYAKEALKDEKRLVLLIHNMGDFLSALYADATSNSHEVMAAFFKSGDAQKMFVAACFAKDDAAAHSGRPALSSFASWKTGMFLGGTQADIRLLDLDMPSSERNQRPPAGTGYTNIDNATVKIIMPVL